MDLVGVELGEREHGPNALLGDAGRLGGDAFGEELLEGGALADHATNSKPTTLTSGAKVYGSTNIRKLRDADRSPPGDTHPVG